VTPLPGLRELMRAGVRRSVAAEYRRLLAAGVRRDLAELLAAGPLAALSYARPDGAPDARRVALDWFRQRASVKGNCLRWHGRCCGCWEQAAA
jgi:hypothetical protein